MDLDLYITTTGIHAETNQLKVCSQADVYIFLIFKPHGFREILYTFFITTYLKLGDHRKCLNLKWPNKWNLFRGRKSYRTLVVKVDFLVRDEDIWAPKVDKETGRSAPPPQRSGSAIG